MSNDRDNPPRVMLGVLTELESKAGDTYYLGNLGGLKVQLFRTKKDPKKWGLFLAEKTDDEKAKDREYWNKRGNGGGSDRRDDRRDDRRADDRREERHDAPRGGGSKTGRGSSGSYRNEGLDEEIPF